MSDLEFGLGLPMVALFDDGATPRWRVGTWVMSALHRNPGMIASAAETLDEISGGRFVLGLGACHDGRGADELGYPAGRTVSRYVESLEIVVPMLRGQTVTFEASTTGLPAPRCCRMARARAACR